MREGKGEWTVCCERERGREVGQRRERRREREVFVRKRERERGMC